MSVAEMKKEAISRIAALENETVLKEVLTLLKETEGSDSCFNLSSTYETIKEQYGDVLQKLGQ